MKMRAFWVFLVFAFALEAAAGGGPHAVRRSVEMSTIAHGTIDIDATGKVIGYQLDQREKLPVAVVEIAAQQIPHWKFEPYLVAAKPSRINARMNLFFVAKKLDDGNYAVELRSTSFSYGKRMVTPKERKAMPNYPTQALDRSIRASIIAYVRIDRQGQVRDAAIKQVNLRTIVPANELEHWRDQFARTVLAAVKQWTFNIPPTPPKDGSEFFEGTIQVVYLYEDDRRAEYGTWTAYIPGPIHSAPWAPPDVILSSSEAIPPDGVDLAGDGPVLLPPDRP